MEEERQRNRRTQSVINTAYLIQIYLKSIDPEERLWFTKMNRKFLFFTSQQSKHLNYTDTK